MKKIKNLAAVTLSSALLFSPMLALAEDGSTDVNADVHVHASTTVKHSFLDNVKVRLFGNGEGKHMDASTSASTTHMKGDKEDKHQENQDKHFEKEMEHGQHAVDVRTNMLQKLEDRINGSMHLTSDEKSSLIAQLTLEINALNELKTKIASTTGTSTLLADLKGLRPEFRGALLVMPRTAIIAAADRISNVADLMAQVGVKLDARINAAKDGGADVSAAQSAYTDFQAKLADAKVQAKAANDLVINLNVGSSTSTTTNQANIAVLKSARAKLEAARTDLKNARQDIAVILKTVHGKGLGHGTATTTASTTASTTTP